jgi:RNA polymerase sigma-70 factor, ECF subfamily
MVSGSRFDELLIPHRNSEFNLAYWILQSREDAEDAVQDAYVRAFRAFDRFTGAGPRAWLLAIVRNVAYSALEARKQEGQQILLDALTRLPPIHRDILVLPEMEGLSYAEISQITGTAIGTVMSRVSRARAELLCSVKGQLREPVDKSKAVLKGRQHSTRSLDIKADVAAAHSNCAGHDRESIFLGSRCRGE